MSKTKPPCQAVILVRCEIYENLPSGQVSGVPIERTSELFTFKGRNQEEVKQQVEEFMKRVKDVQEKE